MRGRAVLLILVVGDAAVVALAQGLAYLLRFATGFFPGVVSWVPRYAALTSLSVLVSLGVLAFLGAYRLPRRTEPWRVSMLLLRVMLVHMIAVITTLSLFRLGTYRAEEPFLYSRLFLATGWILMYGGLLGWRSLMGSLAAARVRRGVGVRRALIVGPETAVARLAHALSTEAWIGDRVIAQIAIPDAGQGPQSTPEVLRTTLDREHVDVVWLAWTSTGPQWVINLLKCCADVRVAWAMPRSQFERFILHLVAQDQGGASASDEVVADAAQRIQHRIDPLEGPRIAMLGSRGIPATYGGVERAVDELSRRLASFGFQVSVYCRPHYTRQRGTYEGVELRHLPCIRTKHLEAASHTLLATIHVLFREDEIIHYQALGPALLAWLPRLFGRKTVVTVQGLDWQRRKWGRIARGVLRLGEWASVRLPHRTIVVSRALEAHYHAKYRVPVTCLPNGVNDATIRSVRQIRRWGLEADSFLLSVGRLVPEKGHDLLIRAFARVRTDKRLVIAGGESHSHGYVADLHAMVTDPRIVFTGYVYGTVFEELLSNAYLFVTASEVEGLPFTLLEAMTFGRCVVASDIPPHVEVLGGLGRIFQCGNEADLAAVLQSLLDDPEGVAGMGIRLREHVRSHYSWDPVARATARLYEDLLVGRSG